MIIPKALHPGDTVMLLSASSPTPPERLQPAIESIEKLGLNVIVGETCTAQHGNLAGSDELRARELNEAFANPKIDGIICIRGGYGATRILPKLDLQTIRQNPKVFAGYSDVTTLHIVFNQQCGFVTYHTPMPSTELYKLQDDAYTWDSFVKTITDTTWHDYELKNVAGEEVVTVVPGVATGQLVGGNLTLVQVSLGTPYEIDCENKILFLEDIDENTERIDRMLTQLSLAGKLQQLSGIILGGWTNCGPPNPDKPENALSLETIFDELLAPLNIPIVRNVSCGHILPTMSLPLGKMVTLDATNRTITVVG